MSCDPYHLHLYSSCLLNSYHPTSAMALANLLFFNIPDTPRSSITILLWLLARWVVVLWRVSCRILNIFRYILASLSLAFSRFLHPFFFRDRLLASLLNFFSRRPRARGFTILVPSDRVASVFSPRSTPTAFLPLGLRSGISSCTVTATNHLSALLLTETDRIRPL